jgi:hypothetical protein
MMRRKCVSVLFAAALLCTAAFANTAVIENSGENRYKSVRLTPEIYNNANSSLSDLRILDENGEIVPYFIHSGYQTGHRETARYAMSLIDSYLKDDNFYFDYTLAEQLDRDIIATAVEFKTNDTTFAKNVDVYGSYDNIHWEFVQRDRLYNVSDKSKLVITFNVPQKFTHYRFRLNNNLERISFHAVDLTYSVETTQRRHFTELLTPEFRTEEKNRETHIVIDGLKNLRLSEIIIDTDSMFQRTVEALSYGIRSELYNLSFSDTVYRDTSLHFNRSMIRDDTLTLSIHNGDDRPINVTGITVRYYADELVFEGSGETFILRFGADSSIGAPVYDITGYKDEILKSMIDKLDVREIIYDEILPEPEPYDFSLIFNIVIIAVAVLLGVLLFLKLRKNTGA